MKIVSYILAALGICTSVYLMQIVHKFTQMFTDMGATLPNVSRLVIETRGLIPALLIAGLSLGTTLAARLNSRRWMISLSVVSVITMVVGIGFVSLALYLPLTIVINNMDRQDKKAETPITNTEEAARAQPATKPERTQTTEPLKETSPMSTSEVRVNKEWGFAIVRSGADVEYVRWPSLTPLNSEQDDQIDLKNLPPMPGTRRTD